MERTGEVHWRRPRRRRTHPHPHLQPRGRTRHRGPQPTHTDAVDAHSAGEDKNGTSLALPITLGAGVLIVGGGLLWCFKRRSFGA
ncbi:hypothetical protein [Streptomyces sp. NPDC051577]|uniref:hypothetical protein n=1 Tax=Streptomyces sp. NPDC051577 TaxID=3155166 RepID=UPI003412A980